MHMRMHMHMHMHMHSCARTPQDIARARQRSPTATYDVLREAKSGNL